MIATSLFFTAFLGVSPLIDKLNLKKFQENKIYYYLK